MLPPSLTVAADALKVTVVALIVSVMLAVALPVPIVRFSKLPPVALLIVAVKLLASK